jgi:two-component system repressor protein LuxO
MPAYTTPDRIAGPRLLLVDKDAAACRSLAAQLSGSFPVQPRTIEARGGREAADALRAGAFDLVLIELASLDDLSDRMEDAVARLVKLASGALVVTLSEGGSVSAAVAAMRAGAHDFVPLPIAAQAFATRIGELAQRHGKAQALTLDGGGPAGRSDFAGFVGASSQMQHVYEQIERIAPSAAPVFITGESGTGKDVCAEAIHNRGPRAGRRFVAINCAAIPRDLMESELFGAVRGAYTGAHEDRKGAAELADGGTLFLDEIGEMDLSLQAKLLRFLQTGTVSRVGEASPRKIDVRVVAATNRNPIQLIADRQFREDLFYRLHVLPIHLPPLRQRPADIMVLARHFLSRYAAEERKRFLDFSPETANLLVAREWPGNVRQLQNLMRRMVVMFDGGDITAQMVIAADIESLALVRDDIGTGRTEPAILPLWRQEQRIIEDAIARFSGNVALAAAALELSPSTIYRKRQAWGEMEGGRRRGAA